MIAKKEAATLVRETRELMKLGGFRLTKWASSSIAVDNVAGTKCSENCLGTVLKTLGLVWNRVDDTLTIKAPSVNECSIDTKLQMLKTVASPTLTSPGRFKPPENPVLKVVGPQLGV
ncbi:hypothetical protein M514_07193 [Trichuris suis]|uniref:Uncharacterized protein n=1 Tax=Trichuris suis TaxID=68888 RepID=A0A085NC06_9BILA|nr:hypothetical protein M513_07193 [Trichuris suis]KFD67002.1 hypothetical protein M514_07193 [Trichuris suis]